MNILTDKLDNYTQKMKVNDFVILRWHNDSYLRWLGRTHDSKIPRTKMMIVIWR